MTRRGWLAAIGCIASTALAQSFEVATIKAADPESRGRFIRMQTAHQLIARNHSVKTLIAAAYNLNLQTISGGPAWAESDRFDILARTPGDVRPTIDQQMTMLRDLLADRFKLTFHRLRKDFPIYELTVVESGSKLKESEPDHSPEGPPALAIVLAPESVSLPARSATTGELASVLQRAALDRPVIDHTGLTGTYEFRLEWLPDENQFGGLGMWKDVVSAKPDLFTAIQQQLGLRLRATRGPVETLVIDHVERPSDN